MQWTQQRRGEWLRPLLALLVSLRVAPDHVTFLALLLGLAFCPFYSWWPVAACWALALHVLLDGLDGPLARYTNVDSPRGSFTDTVSDQVVVVATTITLMFVDVVSIPAGGAYIFLYTAVVTFAMIRNALAVPYKWLFRPRFLVYTWLLIETGWWAGSLEYVIWACNFALAIKTISGFLKIRGRI